MSYNDRPRSPRAYSPSAPTYRSRSRSPPPPPRRYDERRPQRDYQQRERYGDDDRVPPPRQRDYDNYDDRRVPPPHDRSNHNDRVPPPRDRDYYDDRVPPPRNRNRDYEEGEYDDRVPPPRERRYSDDRGSRRDRDYDRGRDWDRPRRNSRELEYDGGRRGASEPSRDLIFLGLDPELTEKDLEGYLRVEHNYNVESTKIVRDRSTGQSKGFGFAQFATLDQAKRFMADNSPAVSMPALFARSEPRRVKVDYAGSRLDEYGAAAPPQQIGARHDGTRDIGGSGGRVLLLRMLDPGTYSGEVVRRVAEEIVRMLGKGSQREAEMCITRVAMIVDRASSISWGFAFVEVVTPELASALVPFLAMPQSQPSGFLINGVPVAASFASVQAFIPTPEGAQYLLKAAPNGGMGAATIQNPGGEFCTYWHQQAGAVETVPRGSPPVPALGTALELPDEMRCFLGNLAGKWKPKQPTGAAPAAASGFAGAATASESGQPAANAGPSGGLVGGMQPIKISFGNAAKKKKKEDPVMVEIMSKALVDDNDEIDLVGKDSKLKSRTAGAHMIPPTSTSRKVAGFINKWNTKQSELSAPRTKVPKDPSAPPAGVSAANAAPVTPAHAPQAQASSSSSNEFDYSDNSNLSTTGKVACLLCQRQFQSEEQLRKHNAQSALHKARTSPFLNPCMRRKNNALASQTGTNMNYRDRAAERREVHHQPDRPVLDADPRGFKGKVISISNPNPGPNALSSSSAGGSAGGPDVGNKLLAKMGWSGSGLGVKEDGRAEPVRVQQFEERAGLGAGQGREAGRWSGPGGWQRRAKDMTQERFQQTQQSEGQNQN